MKSRTLGVGVLFTTVLACNEPAPPPGASTEPAIEQSPSVALLDRLSDEQLEGRAIYQSVCWTCHGPAGRGDGPAVREGTTGQPPNFITDGYTGFTTDELLRRFEAALSGDGVDPAHPHMQYVVNLIRPERFRAALSYVPALAYPGDLPGSALAGLDLYQARCTACHGDAGDGAGYAATALVTVRPADFRSDTLVAAGDYPGLFARIRDGGRSVHGSSMPAWGVALTDDQIWDLVAYVATFQDRSSAALPGGRR